MVINKIIKLINKYLICRYGSRYYQRKLYIKMKKALLKNPTRNKKILNSYWRLNGFCKHYLPDLIYTIGEHTTKGYPFTIETDYWRCLFGAGKWISPEKQEKNRWRYLHDRSFKEILDNSRRFYLSFYCKKCLKPVVSDITYTYFHENYVKSIAIKLIKKGVIK